jgi:hypothetical protein
MEIKGIVNELAKELNSVSSDAGVKSQQFVDALEGEHRTLQQGIIRVLAGVIYKYADSPCDGRNESAVRLCADLKRTLDKEEWAVNGRVLLPFI